MSGWNVWGRHMLLGGIAYYLMAKFGMDLFSLQPRNITLLWFPSGIGLLMCLYGGTKALPFIFLASFSANFSGMALPSLGPQVFHTVIAAIADSFAAWFAAFMLRRRLPAGLSGPVDLVPFTFFVCVIPTLASATVLAVNLATGGYIPWPNTPDFISMLLVADSLGILLCYPALEDWRQLSRMTHRKHMRWLALTVGILAIIHLAFAWLPAMIFLVIPAFFYMLYINGNQGGLISMALAVSLVASEGSHKLGPFRIGNAMDARLMLVFFMFTTAFSVLGMWLQQRQLLSKQTLIVEQNKLLTEARDDLETRVKERTFELEHANSLLAELSNTDGLTGLANRRHFDEVLATESARAMRGEYALTFILLDVDLFKLYNDHYGHQAGDDCLKTVANALKAFARRPGDLVARYGGEEFAFVLPGVDVATSEIIAENIRSAIEMLAIPHAKSAHGIVTASVGVAVQNSDKATLIRTADKALYRAKQEGRNKVVMAASMQD